MADAIDQLVDDVLVDAYGVNKQLWAFRQVFEDTVDFPFTARILGVDVEVTDVDYDGNDRSGFLAACRCEEERGAVSLLDVVPGPTTADATRRLIDAYRRWAGTDPLSPLPARGAAGSGQD